MGLNNVKRHDEAAQIDEELQHQIAVVEREIEASKGMQREHYRALLRRLQQVLAMQPDSQE